MWTNLINKKQYIGSAVDLSNRLYKYYSTAYMEDVLNRSNSHIYRALLKNGYLNFSLTILEYCDKEKCIERVLRIDFYLSCLPHEYNILEKAGSVLGSTRNNIGENNPMFGKTHSEETKLILSEAHKGKTLSNETKTKISDAHKKIDNPGRFKTGHNHSEETKTKISEALAGENNPMYDKPKPEGSGSPSQAIEVTDIKNDTRLLTILLIKLL